MCKMFLSILTLCLSLLRVSQGSLLIGVLHPIGDEIITDPSIQTAHLLQPVDHDYPKTHKEWKQVYQYKLTNYSTNGPIVIGIPGEYPLDPWWMVKGGLVESAKAFNAPALFQLEHRFYGDSWPVKDSSVDNLKYLNVHQVMGDIDKFIKHIRETFYFTNNKIILYGCSYSGSVVAYFQEFYKGVADISVAGSAVLEWQFQGKSLLKNTYKLYKKSSPKCAHTLTTALRYLDRAITSNSLEDLEALELCSPLQTSNKKNVQLLYEDILNPLTVLATHNSTLNSIPHLCTALEEYVQGGASEFEAFAKLMGDINEFLWKRRCINVSFKDNCKAAKNVNKHAPKVASWARQWGWQLCNEVGSPPATPVSGGHGFGISVPTSYYASLCQCGFGKKYTEDFVSQNVEQFVAKYGGLDRPRNNVIFTVGTHDVYLDHMYQNKDQLPVLEDGRNALVLMNGVSHCTDANGVEYSNDPAVTQGIQETTQIIKEWLGLDEYEETDKYEDKYVETDKYENDVPNVVDYVEEKITPDDEYKESGY